jgi:tRNA-2-methylthio-N6-dimethylallyladenosine synthase
MTVFSPAPDAITAPSDATIGLARKVYIETYGCQMNVADSELVSSILSAAGFQITEAADKAEIILINTCAVRERAEERVIGRASQLHGLRARTPNLTIGILGCMAQHLAETLPTRAPFVDLVMGPDSYRRLPQILADTGEETLMDVRLSRTENYVGLNPARRVGTNAWVTVIRGCDKFCTFCIVPFVRGRERSVAANEILRQVENIAAEGYREVTLLGQTVNSYDDGHLNFSALLDTVCAVPGIERVRFTSPYPVDFTDEVIATMARLPQVCRSLHLPVQSASNAQLESMRRGYTIEEYRLLVTKLRSVMPDLALTTDIIVGFCGESEADFQLTLDLMADLRFDSAFMFKYSEREGTFAHRKMDDDVSEETKKERLQRLIAIQESISLEINQLAVGSTAQVLVEGPSKRGHNNFGRSDQGKVVVFPQAAEPNSLVNVHIDKGSPHTLYGHLVDPQ